MKNRVLFLSFFLLGLVTQVVTSQSTTVKFYLDMNGQIDLGNYSVGVDTVDVAANFNGWGSAADTLVPEGNGIYSVTYIDVFGIGDTLEYKFRINSNWGTSEFLDGQPNRTWVVESNNDTIHHFFDDYIVNAGLTAYFPFSGNAQDESGNNHDGTVNGGIVLDSDRFKRSDSSYYFDGSDDYIDYGSGLGLINNDNNFTISAWIYPNLMSPGQNTILSERTAGNNYELSIFDEALKFSYWSSSAETAITGSAGRFNRHEWFHVVITSGGGALQMWVDGEMDMEAGVSGNIDYNASSNLLIGSTDGFGFMFMGRIDDIRFYDRPLSEEEVQTLFGIREYSKKQRVLITDSDLYGSTTWTSDNNYVLDGMVFLEEGTLTIEEGTVIKAKGTPTTGDMTSSLIITKNAMIDAVGNANDPIIFTSEHDNVYDPWDMDHNSFSQWGGVYLLGSATLAYSEDSMLMPGFSDTRGYFGGFDDNHDAGTLSYVSIRFGGADIATLNPAKGLVLAGIGNETSIDHVEVFATGDDGFGIFGGTVDLKYLVSAFNTDDSYDYDMGWRGSGQFWFGIQSPDNADLALEGGGANPASELPFSDPDLANVTLIGSGVGSMTDNLLAVKLTSATGGNIINSIVTDFPQYGIEVEDEPAGTVDARQRMEEGDLNLAGTIWQNFGNGDNFSAGWIIYPSINAEDPTAQFLVDYLNFPATGNTIETPLINGIDRTRSLSLDPRINSGSPAFSDLIPYPADPFFDVVGFKGAFDDTDSWISGWTALSQMEYLGPINNDLTVTAIHPPGTGNQCGFTSTETVTFEIYNWGQLAQDVYDLAYSIDGGSSWNTVAVDIHIEPESFIMHDVNNIDLSAYGIHEIMAATILPGDENPGNDTLRSEFVNNKPVISSFPYNQDFEGGDGYWTIEGQNPSWELGIPAGDVIIGAASGSNAWMTGLSTPYNNDEQSWVESPCFDFSGLTAPMIEFKIWYYMNYYAAATIQYSTDGGETWSHIGNQFDYLNWYNNGNSLLDFTGNNDGWLGNSEGWELARHTLDGLGGEPNVRFRIAMGTHRFPDATDGFAFDDISIFEMATQDAGIIGITSPYTTCGLTGTESLSIEVHNYGSDTISDFILYYQVDEDPYDSVIFSIETLLSGTEQVFNAGAPYNWSMYTSFKIKTWVKVAGDPHPDNDTLVETVVNKESISVFPYFEDFESGDMTWSIPSHYESDNFSWEEGEPNGSVINDPGNTAWVTNLNGAHGFQEYGYIQSPCFSFSSLSDPMIELKIWRDLIDYSGACWLEASAMGGPWTVIGNLNDHFNWYNEGYEGNMYYTPYDLGWSNVKDPGWVTVRHSLDGLGSVSYVELRIYFYSQDNWEFSEGIAIDDVNIYQKPDFDIRMYEWMAPLTGPELTASEQVAIALTNEGLMDPIDFQVEYSIDGGSSWILDTLIEPTLGVTDTLVYTFAFPGDEADFSAYGEYSCIARLNYPGDAFPDNDSITLTVTNSPLINTFPYWQDFEGLQYWIPGGKDPSWELGVPGAAVIDHAWSETNAWVTNLTGPYNVEEQSWVEGPFFDFSTVNHPVIKLWKWDETYMNSAATFQYSVDSGLTWQQVGDIGTGDNWFTSNRNTLQFLDNNVGWYGTNGEWLMAEHGLDFLAGEPEVQFRFAFGGCTNNDSEGFGFDDIIIYDAAYDGAIIELLYPVSGCGLTVNEKLQVTVQNQGTNTWPEYNLAYQIDGGPVKRDTVMIELTPGETYDFWFTDNEDTEDLSAIGTYDIKVWTEMPEEGWYENDTLFVVVENKPSISTFPYSQGFEGVHYWTAGGQNSSWQLGSPFGSVIDHTASGLNAWTTNLIGSYNQDEQSFVEGPCFDFSGLSAPSIQFKVWSHTNNEAGAALQYSTDAGASWHDVGFGTNKMNWLNSYLPALESMGGGACWQGLFNNYWTAVSDLDFLAGMPDVRFRIVFASDPGASIIYDGFAFDDILIYERPAEDAFLSHINGPVTRCEGVDPFLDFDIINVGTTYIDSFTIVCQVDAETPDSMTFYDYIAPWDVYQDAFEITNHFIDPGEYLITAWVKLYGDLNGQNDSLYIEVVTQPLVSEKPYIQDFENDTHYWAAVFDSYSADEMFYPNAEDRPPGWELGIPEGSVIDVAASGTNAWYTYNDGVPFHDVSAVVSPCFDFSSYIRPTIEFSMWRQLSTMDMGAALQYSLDGGGSWHYIGDTGDTLNWYTDPVDNLWVMERFGEPIGWNETQDAGWVTASHVLDGLGGQEYVKLRFVSRIHGNWDMLDGFAFDDVTIYDLVAAEDAAITAILSPGPTCEYTAAEIVEAEIHNSGTDPISNFEVYYRLNADPPVNETYVATLLAGETDTFTFSTPLDLSDIGMHEIAVWTDLPGDPYQDNDTLWTNAPSYPVISSYPYTQDFEGVHYWLPYGEYGSWELGTPAGSMINSAASGTQAWVTNLSGDHSDYELGYVASPCMDFSTLTNPVFEMSIWTDCNDLDDGAFLEYSLDNGVSWTLLGTSFDPDWYNWESDPGENGPARLGIVDYWTNQSFGWYQVTHSLSEIAGEPEVRLRFTFASDFADVNEGIAFDDIQIYDDVVAIPWDLTGVTVDGIGDESLWTGAPVVPIDGTGPGGASDLSASWRAAWDADNLYVLVEVTDDILYNSIGADVFNSDENDNVELYFDLLNNKDGSGYWSDDNRQLRFIWDLGNQDGYDSIAGMEFANSTGGGGYIFEIKIPWEGLLERNSVILQLASGIPIGFDIVVTDNDDPDVETLLSWRNGDPFDLDGAGTIVLDGRPPINSDALMAAILSPAFTQTECQPPPQDVTVQIVNAGELAISDFDVGFSIDSIEQSVETITDTIDPGDTLEYTFATQADLYSPQYYVVSELKTYTLLAGDEVPQNDSRYITVMYYGDHTSPPGWTVYSPCDYSNVALITGVTEDDGGNIWIGTGGGGVMMYDGASFTTYDTTNSGISENDAEVIYADEAGNILIGFGAGVKGFAFYDGTWANYNYTNSVLPFSNIEAILEKEGLYYIGTNSGLSVFNGSIFDTIYTTVNSDIVGNSVISLDIDLTGNIWIACRNGVSMFDGTTFTNYDTITIGTNGSKPTRILVDDSDKVWIGTGGAGVFMFDGGSWTNYSTANSGLSFDYVYTLGQDNDANMWFGTFGSGVDVFDGGSWTNYSTADVMPSDHYWQNILTASDGKLWIPTYRGLAVYDPAVDEHIIDLWEGWNIFSTYLLPGDPDMEVIMQDLIDGDYLVKVQDESGAALDSVAGVGWVNSIGTLEYQEGFKIKVKADTQLVLSGTPIPMPTSIDMVIGWNIVSYPEDMAEAAATVLDSMVTNGYLEKAQDETGAAYENVPPIGWVDNIGDFNPGEGYKVKVSSDVTMIVYEVVTKSGVIIRPAFLKSEYFTPAYTGNGVDHMNLYLVAPTINGLKMEAGDEIAVYDGEVCVGAVRIGHEYSEYISLRASRDDPTTEEADGFRADNKIGFKAWDASHQTLIENLELSYYQGYPDKFRESGTTLLGVNAVSPTNVNEFTELRTGLGDNYPNPFSNETTIEYSLAQEMRVTITVYDLLGRKIRVLVDEHMPAGKHKVLWDRMNDNSNEMKQGVYFYEMKTSSYRAVKQMSIIN